jgi:hypothetical protein
LALSKKIAVDEQRVQAIFKRYGCTERKMELLAARFNGKDVVDLEAFIAANTQVVGFDVGGARPSIEEIEKLTGRAYGGRLTGNYGLRYNPPCRFSDLRDQDLVFETR